MDSIQSLIDEALASREKHIRSGKYSPSLFGSCYRKQWWNRKDEPVSNPIDPLKIRVFEAGYLFHNFVQDILIKQGWQKEVLIEEEHFKGFADLVNIDEVADIKSQHSKAFWYMDKCKNIIEEKKPNWLQVMWYAIKLEKKYGRLVFISKDDLCIQEYKQEVNDYWKKEVGNEIQNLLTFWNIGVLPPAQPRWGLKKDGSYAECEYCNWRDKCKQIEKGEK